MKLSNEYKEQRKKRIVHMRDTASPSVPWSAIARRLHISKEVAMGIYKKVKQGAKNVS